MAYRFGVDESVRHAIIRCAGEQLDRAIAELSPGIDADPATAVHGARKAIKKERSLLRLARYAMPGEQRRRENAILREAGRSLSGARDSEVMTASIGDLSERFAGQLPGTTFEAIREHLEARRLLRADFRGAVGRGNSVTVKRLSLVDQSCSSRMILRSRASFRASVLKAT